MKYILNGFLIVEGKDDKAYLSSFIEGEIILTNGYDLLCDLPYIKELSKKYTPIILTDSDKAGRDIRNKLNVFIPNAINVEVDINKCNKNNKHGVAECEKDEIINKLKDYLVNNSQNIQKINQLDLINCGVVSKEMREFIAYKFNLGKCNNKTLIHRLSMLEICKDDILKVMEEYNNGN